MANFKVGDRVRVVGDTRSNRKTDEGIIVAQYALIRECWIVQSDDFNDKNKGVDGVIYNKSQYVNPVDLVLISPTYQKLTPKVGDKFKVIKAGITSWVGTVDDGTNFPIGHVVTIARGKGNQIPDHDEDYQLLGKTAEWSVNKKFMATEYLEPAKSEEPKGRWLGAGMLEKTESAQLWVNAIKKQAEHHHMGTPFRAMMMGDWQEEPIKKSIIQKSMSFIKRLTQSADDKTLEKANFTDSCGDLTSTGKEALNSLVFAEKKAALVKLAEEVIAESKE